MSFTLATWNINSVRLREPLVVQFLQQEAPDILCLQECKSPVELIPTEQFAALGYPYLVARGQKGYNGVAILSKLPIEDAGAQDFAGLGHARHVAARLENGVTVHNFYVPAGGDVPDRDKNEKFGQKLDYLTDMRDWFLAAPPKKSILVGDLNIAPREDDVWSHKKLLKVVSHTPEKWRNWPRHKRRATGLISRARIFPRVSFILGGPIARGIGMLQTKAGGLTMSGPRPILARRHIQAGL